LTEVGRVEAMTRSYILVQDPTEYEIVPVRRATRVQRQNARQKEVDATGSETRVEWSVAFTHDYAH